MIGKGARLPEVVEAMEEISRGYFISPWLIFVLNVKGQQPYP